MDFIPIAIFWGLALMGLFGNRSILIYLFFATMPFGSFAVFPPSMTMGLTLTPTPIVACILFLRTFMTGKAVKFGTSAILSPRGLLLLTLFWAVAVLVTIFSPRFFAGAITIVPMKVTRFFQSELLEPTTQNISQIMYLTISAITVVTFARLMLDPKQQQNALKGLCIGGVVAVVTGILDYASHFVTLGWLLAPFRTATYVLMTDVTLEGGTRRVVGLMPESSVYGALCTQLLTLLYFLRHAITDTFYRKKVVPVVATLLLLFVWLSTSSSAYVALVVFFVFALLEFLWRAKSARHGTRAGRELELEFWAAFGVAALIFAVFVIHPEVFDPIFRLFDQMVLKKTRTVSFEERSFWTATSWKALFDTYGLGVGMGGTRTSNEVVAVLSNTGFLGGLLYYGFVLQSMLRRAYPGDTVNAALVSGLRWSFLPGLTAGILAGTTADFGLKNAFLFGTIFAAALVSWQGRHKSGAAVPADTGTQKISV
ncbi:MAG: hypothetical protein NVV72_12415 [Asticcacaulis sp.]|nr:hypothetical protein [Asticcacaulis sp.]